MLKSLTVKKSPRNCLPRKVGASKVGASKIGASKVGATKVGASKVGASKVGATKFASLKALCAAGFLGCFLALGLLAGCGEAPSISAPAQPEEEMPKRLVVGFDQELPPFGFKNAEGQNEGLDLALAAEVCARNDWEFDPRPIDWESKDALLENDTINCIWSAFSMEGRTGDYSFSQPYMKNQHVLVVKTGSPIKNMVDCAGKTVMTQAGSSALALLTNPEGSFAGVTGKFAGGGPQTLGDFKNIFKLLEGGAVDAVVCDSSVATAYATLNGGKFAIAQDLGGEEFAVGFKLGSEAVARRVSETLEEMNEDGTVKKIYEQYANLGVSYNDCIIK